MKNIIIALSFLAFMVSCSSSEDKPVNSDMDQTVSQDDSAYQEGAEDSASEDNTASADDSLEAGLALIEGSDCRTCHQNDAPLIGPSYKDVAEKYSEDDIDTLVSHIIDGSKGIWGEIPMTPHPDLDTESAKSMVKYILSLK